MKFAGRHAPYALAVIGPGATANEPHHVGLSRDRKVLACGGLLSVLKGQKETFFFDVSHPAATTTIGHYG